MQHKTYGYRQIAKGSFVIILTVALSCQSAKDIKPNITARLTEKWWCDTKQLLADQYFEASGVFRQRSAGKTEIGKWALSEDNKTIMVSEVQLGKDQGSWSYGLQEVAEDQLKITFFGGSNTFGVCQ